MAVRLLFLLAVSGLIACAPTASSELNVGAGPSVHATLVDPEGKPIAQTPLLLVQDMFPARHLDRKQQISIEGATDDKGEFTFGHDRFESHLPSIQWESGCSLWANLGEGWQLVDVVSRLGWDSHEENTPLPLTVRPLDFGFRFEVTDESGQAIERARVQLIAGEFGSPVEHLPAQFTDANGQLELWNFPHGNWWVDISAPGFAPVRTMPSQSRASDPPAAPYTVTLQAGRELEVQVLRDTEPVPSALVLYNFPNHGVTTFTTLTEVANQLGVARLVVPESRVLFVESQVDGFVAKTPTRLQESRVVLQLEPQGGD